MMFKVNHETLSIMTKFLVGMLILLCIVFVIALITPKVASFLDRKFKKKNPERVQDKSLQAQGDYSVKSIYDAQSEDDEEKS